MNEQLWWFLARSSGIVAWAFMTGSVLWGAVLATDLFQRRRRPAWLLDLHRWLGALTVGFTVLHLAALWADTWIEFRVVDFLVPLASEWKPVPAALGVVAMWGLVLVQVTSLLMRRMPRFWWRMVHLTSYLTFWFTCLHGIYAGTDATRPIFIVSMAAALLSVMFVAVFRILTRTNRRSRPARARGDTAAQLPVNR